SRKRKRPGRRPARSASADHPPGPNESPGTLSIVAGWQGFRQSDRSLLRFSGRCLAQNGTSLHEAPYVRTHHPRNAMKQVPISYYQEVLDKISHADPRTFRKEL